MKGQVVSKRRSNLRLLYEIYRWSRRFFLLLVLVLIAGAIYVYHRGVPNALIHRVWHQVDGVHDIGFTFDENRLLFDKGWVFTNVALDYNGLGLDAYLEASSVSISIKWSRLLNPKRALRGGKINGGSLTVSVTTNGTNQGYTLREIPVEASFDISLNRHWLIETKHTTPEWEISSRGVLNRDPGLRSSQAKAPPEKMDWKRSMVQVMDWISAIEHVDKSASPGSIELHYDLFLGQPQNNKVYVNLDTSSPIRFLDYEIPKLRLTSHYHDEVLSLNHIELGENPTSLRAESHYDFSDQTISGHLQSMLPPETIKQMLPSNVVSTLLKEGLVFTGEWDIRSTFNKKPIAEWQEHLAATVYLRNGIFRNIPIQLGAAEIKRDGSDLQITNLIAQVGDQAFPGTLQGHAYVNLASLFYDIQFSASCNPKLSSRIFQDNLKEVLQRFSYSSTYPKVSMRIWGTEDEVSLTGNIRGENFTYRDVPIRLGITDIAYSNRVLYLENMLVDSAEKSAQGHIHVDFKQKQVYVEATSFIQPERLVKAIQPDWLSYLTPFTFKGQTFMELEGIIDYGKMQNNDLQGTVYVEDSGLKRLLLEDCYFQYQMYSNQLSVLDMRGLAQGGELFGLFIAHHLDSKTNKTFLFNGGLQGADLEALVERNFSPKENVYSGIINAELSFKGPLTSNMLSRISGYGNLSIKEGQLYKIPLLLGFSKYLSQIIPGFGYAAQSDFSSDFTLEEGVVSTENATLKGNIISAKGKGRVGLDKSIYFKVQAKPLKEGVVAELFRAILSPISYLLEFKLTGTTDEPRWRLDHIPKELFLDFD